MGTLSAKMTLKDGYGFGGFSLAPPSKQHLSTPPPPPGGGWGFDDWWRSSQRDATLLTISV